MPKYDIQVHSENCTGCLRCQLACSDLYDRSFRLTRSRIQVLTRGPEASIWFTEDCNACGICVDHCFQDALEKSKRENP